MSTPGSQGPPGVPALASSSESLSETSPHLQARVGLSLGEWRVGEVLGVGGMACVYGADNGLGQEVAVKILHPDAAANPEVVERFTREGWILEQLAGHPSALGFFGAGETPEGHPFMVLERLRGQELSKLWEVCGRRLDVDEAIRICEPILELLELCHARNIVHRDLKPANIYICEDGTIKVLDFGVARARPQEATPEGAPLSATQVLAMAESGKAGPVEVTRVGLAVGTAAYMAPEQAIGRSDLTDGRADVFAVGAMLYQLVSGSRLRQGRKFDELFLQAATTQAPSLARVAPDLPMEFIHAVDKACAWDPRERFQSAREMREALLHFQAHGSREQSKMPEGLGGTVPVPVPLLELGVDEGSAPVAREEALLALSDVLRTMETTMDTARRYGWEHKETQRRFGLCAQAVEAALRGAPDGLEWEVKPSAFTHGEDVVWEPEPPWNSIPYNLFGAGIHYLQLTPGMGGDELQRFLQFLMLDPAQDLSEEDDLGVRLWELGFEHVQFQLVSGFHFVEHEDAGELADLDGVEKDGSEDQEAKELLGMLLASGKNALAEAHTLRLGVAQQLSDVDAGGRYGPLPPEAVMAISASVARGEQDVARTTAVLVHALWEGERTRDLAKLAPCLEDLVPSYVHAGCAEELVELLSGLIVRLQRRPELLRFVLTTSLGGPGLRMLLDAVGAPVRGGKAERVALLPVLNALGEGAVEAVLALAPRTAGVLYEDLIQFLFTYAPGSEAQLGAALPNAKVDFGRALLRILAQSPGSAGLAAIRRARENADAELRLAAVQVIAEAFPGQVAEDVAPFLADPDPGTRIRVLRLLAKATDPALVPRLMQRLGSPEFEALPNVERRLILEALYRLDPARTESALILLLSREPARSRTPEQVNTRMLALQYLVQWGTGARALDVLDRLSQARTGAPADIRKRAALALEQLRQRLAGGAP